MIQFTLQPDSIAFSVKVVPGASRDKLIGEYDGGLKVTVAQPPQAGAANNAVVVLLANVLNIPKDQISITHGHSRPRKVVRIVGLTENDLRERLGVM